MGQIHLVVIIVELDLETQGVINLLIIDLPLELGRSLQISDAGAIPVPAIASGRHTLLRINQRFHPMIITAVRLYQICYVKGVLHVPLGVRDLEKVPLGHQRLQRSVVGTKF
jgi:hypothetical protein